MLFFSAVRFTVIALYLSVIPLQYFGHLQVHSVPQHTRVQQYPGLNTRPYSWIKAFTWNLFLQFVVYVQLVLIELYLVITFGYRLKFKSTQIKLGGHILLADRQYFCRSKPTLTTKP